MDLINEYEKEIKELKKQKESIEKLSEQSANLKVERDKKKQELDKIQDYKSAFYEDLSKEYSEKDSEFATSLAHEELAKRNLKRNLEEKKSEILNGLETKLVKVEENRNNEFAKMEQDEVKKLTEEKKKLEEELKLNDVTKEEWLKLPREEQIRVNHAKEQYLNNKHRLEEIEPKLEIANLYEGKTPIEKYTEIKEKMDVINKEFTLENLDNLVEKLNQKESKEKLEKDWEEAIKENEDFDRRKAVRKDLDERTEKAIENNKKEIYEENSNPKKTSKNTKKIEELKEQFKILNDRQKEKVVGIEVKEGNNVINITTIDENNEKQTIKIENKIEEILNDKKKIFAEPEVVEVLNAIEPSKFKQFLLKRKLSPIVLKVLNENKQNKTIIDYMEAIKNKENCENLEIKHDLSRTVLKGNLKRMMKRIAKTENKIDGMEVLGLQESKIAGLLGKRKIKNIPSTIKEGIKLSGKIKAVEAVKNFSKKTFKKGIKVKGAVQEGLKKVAETYKEGEDLEKLEDKEDPDLEETQPKSQDGEER